MSDRTPFYLVPYRHTDLTFRFVLMRTILPLLLCVFGAGWVSVAQSADIVHDAEYYILEAQNGERWKAEDGELDKKLANLRKKHGQPPNIIHIMWDDQSFGDCGIPEIQKIRGYETPHINRIACRRFFEGYLAAIDAVLLEMMTDVAEIRLMDMQPQFELSDEQVEQLAPIMGAGMLSMVRLLFKNADQKLTMPKKVKLGKAFKKTQSDMDKQINAVLTENQQKAYFAYKEAQKG